MGRKATTHPAHTQLSSLDLTVRQALSSSSCHWFSWRLKKAESSQRQKNASPHYFSVISSMSFTAMPCLSAATGSFAQVTGSLLTLRWDKKNGSDQDLCLSMSRKEAGLCQTSQQTPAPALRCTNKDQETKSIINKALMLVWVLVCRWAWGCPGWLTFPSPWSHQHHGREGSMWQLFAPLSNWRYTCEEKKNNKAAKVSLVPTQGRSGGFC